MTGTPSALDRQLRDLIDKDAIRDVVLRYCRGIDRRDADLIRSAYHHDVTEHHGAYRGDSVDDFVDYAGGRSDLFDRVCHYVTNHLIELDGDVAYSEAYAIALHRSRIDGVESNTIFGGRYVDTMERRDGRWAIADRVVVCDWSRVDIVDPWTREELFASGMNDRTDPVYHRGEPRIGALLRSMERDADSVPRSSGSQ